MAHWGEGGGWGKFSNEGFCNMYALLNILWYSY